MTALTFAVVLLLSAIFFSQLLGQRVAQTASANDVLAHQVLLATRQAIETGLTQHPPQPTTPDRAEDALNAAVTDALRSSDSLSSAINAVIRYSPTAQDVSITDAHNTILLSTDPDSLNQSFSYRTPLDTVASSGFIPQTRIVFGRPRVFDVALPLDRNGAPFLIVHIGVRSTFLRASYQPFLHAALIFTLLTILASLVTAAFLANIALRPIESISARLDALTLAETTPLASGKQDAVVRASQTIDRLGARIRNTEEVFTTLQSNLNQMLETLKDGVILFTPSPDPRAVMVSESAARFLARPRESLLNTPLSDIFPPDSPLAATITHAFATRTNLTEEPITLPNNRQATLSIDFIHHDATNLGALLTLHDLDSALQLEQELEVSRRLAAIGRLTAGVGHEVKNPINAMVLHLELLRSKLATTPNPPAQKHVDVLSSEMQRLDRVVQTLADFSRPLDLDLRHHSLQSILAAVLDLTAADLARQHVTVETTAPADPIPVRVDDALIRQALLNIVLNGAQAMEPLGGTLTITLSAEPHTATLRIADQGPGIPPTALPRIFDLYFTTKATGSGIGLAMTSRIIQLHGGAIHVDSTPQGATFTVTLPLDTAHARPASNEAAA